LVIQLLLPKLHVFSLSSRISLGLEPDSIAGPRGAPNLYVIVDIPWFDV
jgi:hypothetical protein